MVLSLSDGEQMGSVLNSVQGAKEKQLGMNTIMERKLKRKKNAEESDIYEVGVVNIREHSRVNHPS